MQKYRQHRQNALRRFLATLATIGRIIAPDFDGANPQGVQWDSLESFTSIGARQVVETLALRAFLRAQRRQLYYMYCSHTIYIIYLICLQYMCVMWKNSGAMKGELSANPFMIFCVNMSTFH